MRKITTARVSRFTAAPTAKMPSGISSKTSSPPAPGRRSDKPDILNTLELKFLDDCKTFDKATAAFLREHFNKWKSNNWHREQPRASFARMPRYECFIWVDREALDSVLVAPGSRDAGPGATDPGWVHFVDALWTAALDGVDSETEETDMPDLDFEPIEGCREEDVGWIKVPARSICTELYALFDGYEIWDALYGRPPEMAVI